MAFSRRFPTRVITVAHVHDQILSHAAAVGRHGEQDPQLCGVHHLAYHKGTNLMDTEAVGGLTDSLAGYQAAVCNEGDGLLGLAGLEIAQDHMELIQKFMIEGPQGVQHGPGAGQLV